MLHLYSSTNPSNYVFQITFYILNIQYFPHLIRIRINPNERKRFNNQLEANYYSVKRPQLVHNLIIIGCAQSRQFATYDLKNDPRKHFSCLFRFRLIEFLSINFLYCYNVLLKHIFLGNLVDLIERSRKASRLLCEQEDI